MDGENLELADASFDVVLSRLGLIVFPNQDRALAKTRRALRLGGRVVLTSYTWAENNRFFSIPIAIIRRPTQLPAPAPGGPGPISLGPPSVLEAASRRFGFSDVTLRLVAPPRRLSSAGECVRFRRDSFAALHQMLAGVPETEREAAWGEIGQELRQFEGAGGLEVPAKLLVGSAVM